VVFHCFLVCLPEATFPDPTLFSQKIRAFNYLHQGFSSECEPCINTSKKHWLILWWDSRCVGYCVCFLVTENIRNHCTAASFENRFPQTLGYKCVCKYIYTYIYILILLSRVKFCIQGFSIHVIMLAWPHMQDIKHDIEHARITLGSSRDRNSCISD